MKRKIGKHKFMKKEIVGWNTLMFKNKQDLSVDIYN